jgi:glycerol-3-phosphate dehydrogenase (NAD(P)+)
VIGILGAGAFGTALAAVLARDGREVVLWGRNAETAGYSTRDAAALRAAKVILITVPMQVLGQVMAEQAHAFADQPLIACCKGIDLATLTGPSAVMARLRPNAMIGVLTGPSFATDILRGMPTALTLAYQGADAIALQAMLSTKTLRLYHSTDIIGAELGGALKNVIAIAAGIVMGAGLGASAQAALISRGFAEMQRMALAQGGRAETLAGLSGLGDLVLTCGTGSRNYQFGLARGAGHSFDPKITVEGVATAKAVAIMANTMGLEMPITQMVAALLDGKIELDFAISALMSRPLKKE